MAKAMPLFDCVRGCPRVLQFNFYSITLPHDKNCPSASGAEMEEKKCNTWSGKAILFKWAWSVERF